MGKINLKDTQYNIFKFNLLTSLLSVLNHHEEDDTEFIIARYFITHLPKIKKISIYKVAEECFVSRSSIQRFIKSIGYESYTQLKESADEVVTHEMGFTNYTDHAEYQEFLSSSLNEMISDVIRATKSRKYQQLLDAFMKADNIVILTAEDSSHACKVFQQQALTISKLIRIITSASNTLSVLEDMQPDDLLIVCSVTGNFALAINDQIRDISATKHLITMNTTAEFEGVYDLIYYMSSLYRFNFRNIESNRNVYNNYGLNLFFDLFYHDCYMRRRRENWR